MAVRTGVRTIVPPFFITLVAFVSAWIARDRRETTANNYVLLAQAWLHGHAWVAYTNAAVDVVPFHGRAFVVEGPAPALFLIPAVVLFGPHASQSLFANVLGALAAFALFRVSRRAGLALAPSLAATAFGFFGTSCFACATRGDVWFVAHVCAFACSLLAIDECMGLGRGWLVAVFASIAAFSRFPLVLALPFYALLLGSKDRTSYGVRAFVASLVPGFALGAWYDVARWGTIGDPGYAVWYRVMDDRARIGAPMFSLGYVIPQIRLFALRLPNVSTIFPFIVAPLTGYSIVVTSLPFGYAVFAGAEFSTFVLAGAAFVTAIPSLIYYDTGQVQYGMRHALDFEPFLFALVVVALARRPSRAMTFALLAFAAFGTIEGVAWLEAVYAR